MAVTPTGSTLTVTQVKSAIGSKPKHRGTLRALGLHGIGSSKTLPDRPDVTALHVSLFRSSIALSC